MAFPENGKKVVRRDSTTFTRGRQTKSDPAFFPLVFSLIFPSLQKSYLPRRYRGRIPATRGQNPATPLKWPQLQFFNSPPPRRSSRGVHIPPPRWGIPGDPSVPPLNRRFAS